MTLTQFAVAVGATPKWVQNAAAVLGRRIPYTVPAARQLALARQLHTTLGLPLAAADRLARRALAEAARGADATPAVASSADGSVRALVDVPRFLSSFTAALSRALAFHTPKRRGRPPTRAATDPVAAARAYGVDIGLLEASLRRSPAERLRRLDADMEFVRALRRRAAAPPAGR